MWHENPDQLAHWWDSVKKLASDLGVPSADVRREVATALLVDDPTKLVKGKGVDAYNIVAAHFRAVYGDEPEPPQTPASAPVPSPTSQDTAAPAETPQNAAQGAKTAQLTVVRPSPLLAATTDNKWEVMKQQAEIMVRSGFMPKDVNSAEKVMTIGMMSEALGIPMIVGVNNIDVIVGKPTLKPQLMLALIERSGLLEDMSIEDDGKTCKVMMRRKGRSPHTETFSMDDADRMTTKEWDDETKRNKTVPLSQKYNWRSQPKTMRKWRAISACARVLFSDVILGFYTPEELDPDIVVEAA